MRGRVDIVGRAGTSSFVLIDKEATKIGFKVTVHSTSGKLAKPVEQPKKIDWVWKIATGAPENRYVELANESLFQVLMRVAGQLPGLTSLGSR
jgi:hypothetical protein